MTQALALLVLLHAPVHAQETDLAAQIAEVHTAERKARRQGYLFIGAGALLGTAGFATIAVGGASTAPEAIQFAAVGAGGYAAGATFGTLRLLKARRLKKERKGLEAALQAAD